jgi:hypothetical protein
MEDILRIQKGNPSSLIVTITDDNGNALNLTGRTVFFTVKRKNDYSDDDEDAVISKEVTEHTDPTNGKTAISLTATQTDVDRGIYKADIRVYGEGLQRNTTHFFIEIEETVTKRTE